MKPAWGGRLIVQTFVCLLLLAAHARAAPTWRRVATHPEAAAASATWGARWLWGLYPWRGRLFLGYGSFNGTNPRAVIRAFDPAINRLAEAPAFATNNEAAGLFRLINNRLYVPTMDSNDGGLARQDFAVTTDERGDVWTDHVEQPMYHVWDVATLDGSDLWFVGTTATTFCPLKSCSDAVAYRSMNGGATFTEVIRLSSADAGYNLVWFPFACAFNGKLYLQAFYRFSTTGRPDLASAQSLVFDGSVWTTGPDLLPGRLTGVSGYAPVVFDRHMLYLSRVPIARSYPNALPLWQNEHDLIMMDETERVRYLQIPGGVANFTIAGRYLYVLTRDGSVRRTRSVTLAWKRWEVLTTFPVQDPDARQGCAGRSIAALDDKLYVGTTQGELWQLDLPGQLQPSNTKPTSRARTGQE